MKHERHTPQTDFPIDHIKSELQENLFLTKDLQTHEKEGANILEELNNKFAQYRWFFGLALMGSRIRGYSTEGSDVDLKIFYDSSEISNVALAKIIKQYTKEIEGASGYRPRHISIPYFVGIDIHKIQTGIQNVVDGRDDNRYGFNALLTIKDLSGLATGEKISEIHQKIKDMLSKLDAEKRIQILDRIIDYAVMEEQYSENKLMRRLRMNEEDMAKFWETRRKLWSKRINELWA